MRDAVTRLDDLPHLAVIASWSAAALQEWGLQEWGRCKAWRDISRANGLMNGTGFACITPSRRRSEHYELLSFGQGLGQGH
jgi:hypothetical protein